MSERLDDVEHTPGMDIDACAPQEAAEDQQIVEKTGHPELTYAASYSRDRPIEELGRARSAKRFQIFFRFQHDAERFVDHSRIERVPVERDERGHPVDGLRHAGHLVEVFGAQLLHHRGHLLGQPRRRLGSALANDRHFLLERRDIQSIDTGIGV